MLSVENLTKYFRRSIFDRHPVYAVNQVSFTLQPGQALGLMGKSGSGKSTIGRLLARLIEPSDGRIIYQETDITALTEKQLRPYRHKLQIIFQQPVLALDPKQTIKDALLEPLLAHKLVKSRQQAMNKIADLLSLTNLSTEILARYPRQISGGQAQRIVIARALTLEPEVIIADEATAMLDISVQAQILTLLKQLQQQLKISIVLISHDEAVIRAFCNKVVMLDQGKVTAIGTPETILGTACHDFFALRKSLETKGVQ